MYWEIKGQISACSNNIINWYNVACWSVVPKGHMAAEISDLTLV